MNPPDRTRLATLIVLTTFSFLLGLLFRSPLMLAFGEALLAVIGLAYFSCRLALRGLTAEREFSPRAFEDDDVEVRLTVENRSWVPAYLVEIHDRISADVISWRSAVIQSLPGRTGSRSVRYAGQCTRGRGTFRFGPLELAVTDALGLFHLRRTLESNDTLIVYPRPFPIRKLDLEAHLRGVFAGATEIPSVGHTTNFYGLREYRPGEPARRIHWRASARRGRLLLMEFEAPSHTDVTLFLDLDRASLRGVGRGSNVDVAIRLCASVARFALDRGHSVRLVAHAEASTVIPARSGRAHLLTILETLAHVQPRGKVPYLELLERGTPLLPEGGRVMLVFNRPHGDIDRFLSVWADWRRRGIEVLAAVIDDKGFYPLEAWGEAVSGTARIDAALDRMGIPWLAIAGPEPVETVTA